MPGGGGGAAGFLFLDVVQAGRKCWAVWLCWGSHIILGVGGMRDILDEECGIGCCVWLVWWWCRYGVWWEELGCA